MAGTSSISGLASGFDSTSVITSLMAIEALPQKQLQAKLTTTQTQATAYRAINTAFAALQTAAQDVTKAAAWSAATASSSSTSVAATAGADATPGSLTFTVDQLAQPHALTSQGIWTTKEDTGLGASMAITSTGVETTVDLDTNGDGVTTIGEAVAAINAADAGVRATKVNTGNGYKLQLTATTTGAAAAFTLDADTTPAFGVTSQGQDAELTVGSTNGYKVTSASNTFDEVLGGTSFTVSSKGATATIDVTADPAAVTASVQAMVDAANNALATIAKYATSSATSTTSSGPLSGDYSMKQLKNSVLSALSGAVGDQSAASAGLEVDRYGAITFDADAFTKAVTADPTLVQRLFQGEAGAGADGVENTVDDTVVTDGVGARLQLLAAQATDKVNGSLVVLANGMDTRATDLKGQITDWDSRLEKRQATLTAKFTAMESALSTLKGQASWLTSQLSSMPTWSSSSSSN